MAEDSLIKIFLYNTKSSGRELLVTKSPRPELLKHAFCTDNLQDFNHWIVRVCTSLLGAMNVGTLVDLVNLNTAFAHDIFPTLIKLYLACDNEELNKRLEKEVAGFFRLFYLSFEIPDPRAIGLLRDKKVVRCMLMVAECNRLQHQELLYSGKFCVPKMTLNYVHVAKAAEYCQAHFTAILYGELWAFVGPPDGQICHDIKKKEPPEVFALCKTLQKSYKEVGGLDIYRYLIDPLQQRQEFLLAHNLHSQYLLEMTGPSGQIQTGKVLMEDGLFKVAQSVSRVDDELKYEIAWRLGDWSVLDQCESTENFVAEFEKSHYSAIKRYYSADEKNVSVYVDQARDAVTKMLKNTAIESPRNLYKFFGMLNLLQQIEDFCKIRFRREEYDKSLEAKFNSADRLPTTDFYWTEKTLSQRLCLFEGTGIRALRDKSGWVQSACVKTTTDLITSAFQSEKNGIASFNIARLKQSGIADFNKLHKLQVIEAELYWQQGCTDLSKLILKNAVKEVASSDRIDAFLVRIDVYSKLGEMAAEGSHAESPTAIFDDYYHPAIDALHSYIKQVRRVEQVVKGVYDNDEIGRNLKSRITVYETTAKFFDREYVKILTEINSVEHQQKQDLLLREEMVLNELCEKIRNQTASKEEKLHYKQLQTNYKIDEMELQQVERSRVTYVTNALKYYLTHMRHAHQGNLNIFRIISLWLANKQVRLTFVSEVPFIFYLII